MKTLCKQEIITQGGAGDRRPGRGRDPGARDPLPSPGSHSAGISRFQARDLGRWYPHVHVLYSGVRKEE